MARPDPMREGLGRRVALLRVWGGVAALLPALGLVPHGGWPIFAVGLLVEAIQAVLSMQLVKQIRDGTDGELLYVAGGRVSERLVQTQQLVERIELGIGLLSMVGLVVLATPWTLVHAALSFVLWATVLLAFRVQWRATRLLLLLHARRAEEALALSSRWRGGRFGALLTTLHVTALLMNRRIDEARKLRAEVWNGSVDRAAVGVALDRIQAGDGKLAHQVVAVLDDDDRYARYSRALLSGHLALLEDDPTFQVDDALLDALPAVMAEELRLVDAAVARQRGDEARAAARLAPIELDAEDWRSAAYPRLWRALGGTPRAPVAARAPMDTSDVFSPPSEVAGGPRRRWTAVGALPVAKAPLTAPWRPFVQGALVLLSLFLLGVSLLLMALHVGGAVFLGRDPLTGAYEVTGVGLAVSGFVLVRYAVHRLGSRGERGIVLEDGRVLDPGRPFVLYLNVALPFATALTILPALLLRLASLADLFVPALFIVSAWVGLILVQGIRRLRLVGLVRAAHLGSDEDLSRATRTVHQHAKAWAVLAHYLRGDVEAARKAGENALLVADDVTALLRWDAAARGDLSVDDLVTLPPPPELGPRFCHAVAVRLAALAQGTPERVPEPAVAELVLPNRIGEALLVLDHELLKANTPEAARRFATSMAAELRRGAWIRRTWPHLFPRSAAGGPDGEEVLP